MIAMSLIVTATGCAWQPYVVTRSLREVLGSKTRVHVIVPIERRLTGYRHIELHALNNTLPGHVPQAATRYLDARLATELAQNGVSVTVVHATDDVAARSNDAEGDAGQSLVIDGYLDDFNAGSRSLRIVELGFNHIAVTVRVRIRDKHTHRLLGAVSVTAEDDRATGTTSAAIDRVVGHIRAFIEGGYAR